MSFMFYKCNSLISLPDISKLNIYGIEDMNNMFYGCNSSLKLPDVYIFYKNKKNIIFELTYKNKGKTKILGREFIKRNRNRCSIIYNNCEFELKEYFEDIDINYNHKDLIKLKLLLIHNIINMSYMFYDCSSLISLSINNDTNLNISKSQIYIINMSYMFYRCESLISLPDIKN